MFLDLVLPGRRLSLTESPARPECVGPLRQSLDGFGPNLEETLDRLIEADPELRIVVMTLSDLFWGDTTGLATVPTVADMGEMALEGLPGTPFPGGLNDIIREEVEVRGLPLVEWWPLFEGKALQLTADEDIHSNDEGYRVMADAVLGALADACPDGLTAC